MAGEEGAKGLELAQPRGVPGVVRGALFEGDEPFTTQNLHQKGPALALVEDPADIGLWEGPGRTGDQGPGLGLREGALQGEVF